MHTPISSFLLFGEQPINLASKFHRLGNSLKGAFGTARAAYGNVPKIKDSTEDGLVNTDRLYLFKKKLQSITPDPANLDHQSLIRDCELG